MVIEAADNIALKTKEFVVKADNTRINSEVVINGGVNVKRLMVTPANIDAMPPVTAVMEKVTRCCACMFLLHLIGCRLQVQQRPVSFVLKARTDVWPATAEVMLTVQSREGDGTTDAEITATTKTLSSFCRQSQSQSQSQRKRGYACA